jgi:hypothetical protein
MSESNKKTYKLATVFNTVGRNSTDISTLEIDATRRKTPHGSLLLDVVVKSGENIKNATHWTKEHEPMLTMTEDGNGFQVECHKWSSMTSENSFRLDYSQADNLRRALNLERKLHLRDRGAVDVTYPYKVTPTEQQLNSLVLPKPKSEEEVAMMGLSAQLESEMYAPKKAWKDAYEHADHRPLPPKGWEPDGNDNNVETKYAGPELCVGDSMKVILRQIYDMSGLDGLQKHEILALIKATIDEHIIESEQE